MILNFEYPYADEVFYSWIVRMYTKSPFIKADRFRTEVLSTWDWLYHDAIGGMEKMEKEQRFYKKELEEIIENNSFLELTEPFTHPVVQGADRREILTKNSSMIRVGNETVYKVCPICYLNDRETKGEAYLRIYHQVQGVYVCLEHGVDLIEIEYNIKQLEPIHIEQVSITNKYFENKYYERIAQMSITILKNNTLRGLDEIQCIEKYKRKIDEIYKEDDLEISKAQKIRLVENELEQYYGRKFLEHIGCGKGGNVHYNWFRRVLAGAHARSQPTVPVHYLLLIDFLFGSVEEFKDY